MSTILDGISSSPCAIPLENMLAETAFAKLSWVLGNFQNPAETMLKNFLGEFNLRIQLKQKEI